MSDKELSDLMDLLYPYFVKKIKSDNTFKNCIRSMNATVVWVDDTLASNIGAEVKIRLPYDTTDISVINKSTSNLAKDDLVCVHYYIDLKNAYIAYKV